ncbi:MAG: twin-arginine translocase subunit TatC [Acidobacteriota bacterium]|nr:twin-arginine translocase subunit TatC [Acidobacteriota bacterium]
MRKARKSPDEMTFLEHLEDLRKRLFLCFISIFVAVLPAYVFSKDIYAFLARPLTQFLPEGQPMAFLKLTEPFMLYIKVSFITALFAVSPFLFYQIWKFIAPGLYQKEKKYVMPFVLFTTIFFIGGAAFSYYVAYPFACRFFLDLGSDFKAVITVDQFFNLTVKMLIGVGLVFEMPTLIFFLARMGIVTSKWMVKNIKYAVLAIFVIAAVITPSPDMVNQLILAVPMLVLYGISILVALLFGRERKDRKARKEEASPAG